jgi:hypothetical protein
LELKNPLQKTVTILSFPAARHGKRFPETKYFLSPLIFHQQLFLPPPLRLQAVMLPYLGLIQKILREINTLLKY